MAKVIKSVAVETVHTIELTDVELSYIVALLGQCVYNGSTSSLHSVLSEVTVSKADVRAPAGIVIPCLSVVTR